MDAVYICNTHMKVDPYLCKASPALFKILNSHPTIPYMPPYHSLPILIFLNVSFLSTRYMFNIQFWYACKYFTNTLTGTAWSKSKQMVQASGMTVKCQYQLTDTEEGSALWVIEDASK